MSLDLAVSINIVLDVALLAGLAYSMASPRKLTPHRQPTRDVVTESYEQLAERLQAVPASQVLSSLSTE